MPRPRWTTRRIMVAIALLAVGLGLGCPAAELVWGSNDHYHGWMMTDAEARAEGMLPPYCGEALMQVREVVPSFWACYARRLRGWPPTPCRESRTHPDETCSLRPSP